MKMSTSLNSSLLLLLAICLHSVYSESEQFYSPNDLEREEVPDAATLLHEIHTPTSNVAHIHQISRSFLSATKELLSYIPRHRTGLEANIARSLMNLQRLDRDDLELVLSERSIITPHTHRIICDSSKHPYRTMDGNCNNLVNPCWGKAEEPYQRWLPPDYANGVDELRKGFDGADLPPPRFVNQRVPNQFEPNSQTVIPHITNLLVTWGQLLSHDIVLTPSAGVKVFKEGKWVDQRILCCNGTFHHPDCVPLITEPGDTFFPPGHCVEFVRSTAYAHRESSCAPPALGQRREQLNQLTSFIDASVVYGSSDSQMRATREHGGSGAKLVMSKIAGRDYLPRRSGKTPCKSSTFFCDQRCFLAGERRANENPALAALHTLLARHHNRLVDRLRPRGWSEETLFHVVRKIVGAQIQHITYNEYLQLLLGDRLMSLLKLSVPTDQYRYDHHLNPTIYNVFATAAFRFGHSMLSGQQKRRGRTLDGSPVLSQDFFSMDEFCDTTTDSVSKLLIGQSEQRAQKVDAIFTKEVTDHLFSETPDRPGLDLFSLNIQRGRDHGIPSYNHWREACGLKKARDYSDLLENIPAEIVSRLEGTYGPGRVDNIDLYVGGISEMPVNNGILGPTFTCIIANQFRNLKFGDRFWYENQMHPGAFTHEQLNEIRKTTLASLICENSEVDKIQPHVLVVEGRNNPKFHCISITRRHALNLAAWP